MPEAAEVDELDEVPVDGSVLEHKVLGTSAVLELADNLPKTGPMLEFDDDVLGTGSGSVNISCKC